nr:immunoglobulin heavy chain junction region [Macaca mulatta]MOV35815.1 immunoglobulin heavy chain junction region [Macaca mulatta]MOV36233.1 immunoglobulin heavy chain junction region [Macaca mulatta]MOV36286.1 immunoglobulin heavy chain junction region [Macaca mulatta]MOV36304.1 immunoglobulin heavy chain junction region [Macaca mulatta]
CARFNANYKRVFDYW